MKPVKPSVARGIYCALAGVILGFMTLGFAFGVAVCGYPWIGFSASCYGVIVIWFSYSAGRAAYDRGGSL